MRDYEMTFVVRTDMGDDLIKAAAERVQSLITQRGGQLTNVQQWGRRRLAYPISHQREGNYYVYRFEMEPERATELEHELNLDEQVLRFLVVHLDHVALEALKNPPPPMQAPERRRPAPPAAEAPEAPAAEQPAQARAAAREVTQQAPSVAPAAEAEQPELEPQAAAEGPEPAVEEVAAVPVETATPAGEESAETAAPTGQESGGAEPAEATKPARARRTTKAEAAEEKTTGAS